MSCIFSQVKNVLSGEEAFLGLFFRGMKYYLVVKFVEHRRKKAPSAKAKKGQLH